MRGTFKASPYDPAQLEARRQRVWRELDAYGVDSEERCRAPVCVYVPAPFTSGRLHIGHVRSYSIADAYARFKRAQGCDVLFSIGFDAFGLPAELEAIRRGLPIDAWVAECSTAMREQMEHMGFSVAWEREFITSDDTIYRWSQRLFHLLYEAGLAYRAQASVDWCDSCRTVLAQLQVEDGTCWRCGTAVRIVQRPQWYVKVSAYVDENDRRLARWDDRDHAWVASQRDVLARVTGVELEAYDEDGRPLTVFTKHPASLQQSEFVVISPRHPDIEAWTSPRIAQELLDELRTCGWRRDERSADNVPVALSGHQLQLPGLARRLPLAISPIVDARYGATAVLGIPSAERPDELLARRLGVKPLSDTATVAARIPARPATRDRACDIAISRQRSWGAPIPIVYCDRCGTVPVPVAEQPVRLPDGLRSSGTEDSLAARHDFIDTSCPQCGQPARRETDTLDCHFDAMWLWIPSCVPTDGRRDAMFDHKELQHWLPAEMVVWGADGGQYMFDQRMVAKALRDSGWMSWLEDGEPFKHVLMHEMVRIEGQKMSKHLGNSVDPGALVDQVGADALRLAVLVSAAPRKPLAWSTENLRRSCNFLSELWAYAEPRLRADADEPPADSIETTDPLRLRLARWCDAATRRVTEDLELLELHKATNNVMHLYRRIRQFESRVISRRGHMDMDDERAVAVALRLLVRLLAPFAPHISSELWEAGGGESLTFERSWPHDQERQVA